VPGGPPADPSRLFDERADALLDELVRIIFPQNMKSMETSSMPITSGLGRPALRNGSRLTLPQLRQARMPGWIKHA
jgi:hypothetical protein